MDGNNLVTVRISKDAEMALQKTLEVANMDFTSGRVSRSQLVSWVLVQFEKQYLSRNLEQLRKDHFDPLVYLEKITREVKAAKASGKSIPDLAGLFNPVTGEAKPGRGATRSAQKSVEQVKSSMNLPMPDGESNHPGN